MPMVLLAAIMMAQAPAAAQPSAGQPAAAVKKKAPQVCEYLEITGSRSKRRVCRDADGNLDLGPGVSSSLAGKGTSVTTNGSSGSSSLPQL